VEAEIKKGKHLKLRTLNTKSSIIVATAPFANGMGCLRSSMTFSNLNLQDIGYLELQPKKTVQYYFAMMCPTL